MGFPTLKELTDKYNGNTKVVFVAVQTVFEGYGYNTQEKLRKNQVKYSVKVPMAHAAGDPKNHLPPEIMIKYRSGGTPWTVIIDPEGRVAFNDFHIEADAAAGYIEKLLSLESKSAS